MMYSELPAMGSLVDAMRSHPADAPAIVDASSGATRTYGELSTLGYALAEALQRMLPPRTPVFMQAPNTPDAITLYLACLASKMPVCLLESVAERIITAYGFPALLLPVDETPPDDYTVARVLPHTTYHLLLHPSTLTTAAAAVHPNLALMLTTSGSTGNPKLVRLSYRNVWANARSIATYLQLTPSERSIQGLPISYSYGLSLVNSHVLVGGTIVLTAHSFMQPGFWQHFDDEACTSFAGVPFMYEVLHRLKFDVQQYPTLQSMTQAGGALRKDLISHFHTQVMAGGAQFFVMYGQTEATARMTYVPPASLGEKIGSIGIPIPDGQMQLEKVGDAEDLQELVYSGPNVMLGYATNWAALGDPDTLRGTLHTQDIATVDADGYYTITGRLSRFAKLFGRRVNLKDVETSMEEYFPLRAACIEGPKADQISAFVELLGDVDTQALRQWVARSLNVSPMAVRLSVLDEIPMTTSGKKDYSGL